MDRDALNVDIAPTVLDLAGARGPGEYARPVAGAAAGGQDGELAQRFLTEYFAEKNFPRSAWQGVRTARWKYTHYTDLEGMDELYDLQADPYEMKNVIGEPSAAAALKEMKAELARQVEATK